VLADVHRVDIVHRDIKPGNVMITDGGLVEVLDFAGVRRSAGMPARWRIEMPVRPMPWPAFVTQGR